MARSTMARLIQVVRDLTFAGTAEYTLGTTSYFTDDHVQAYLDDHRRDVWHLPLEALPQYLAGTPTWKEYDACASQWEATADGTLIFSIRDAQGNVSGTAGYTFDHARGHATFAADQAGSARYVTGRVYDVYTAAADLVDAWASRWDRQFDFSIGNSESYRRSQAVEMMGKRATALRAKGWPKTADLVRSDGSAPPRDEGYTGGAAHAARG